MVDELDEVAENYALWATLDAGVPSENLLAVGDLVRYLLTDAQLSDAQTAALFASPQLLQLRRQLLQRFAAFEMPTAAAASDGEVMERFIDGRRVQIGRTDNPEVFFVIVSYRSDDRPLSRYNLTFTQDELAGLKLTLPMPNAQGDARTMLRTTNPRQGAILDALRNADVSGHFVRLSDDGL